MGSTSYGQNIDAHTYLQKFINVETTIPKRTTDKYNNDLSKYTRCLLQLHQIETWGDDRNIVECLEAFAIHMNLSLRQLEKVFTNLAIFYGASGERHLRIVPLVVFLACVRAVRPELFEEIMCNKASYQELSEKLDLLNLAKEGSDYQYRIHWIMEWVKFSFLSEEEWAALPDDNRIKKLGQSLWEYNLSREQVMPVLAQKMSMFTIR